MILKFVFMFILFCGNVWTQQDDGNFNTNRAGAPPNFDVLYDLSIVSANSRRFETTYLEPASGLLFVKGSLSTYYPDTMSDLIVDYVADKTGYRASFKITKSLPLEKPISFETRLTAKDLKSLAG